MCDNTPMNTIQWFIRSSADPASLSLTIKSLATIAVLFGLDSVIVDEGAGHIVTIISSIGTLISAGVAIAGLVRKIKLGRWSAFN